MIHQQITIPLEAIDPLLWLENQTLYPKVYWQDRENKSVIAGVGEVLSFSEIPQFASSHAAPTRLFGGISFAESGWQEVPHTYFFLPSFEIHQTEESTSLRINLIDNKPLPLNLIQKLNFDLKPFSWSPLVLSQRSDAPGFEEWQKTISSYLRMIQNKELEKIVCARKTTLTFKEPLNPFFLLQKLKEKAQKASLFLFQWKQECAFLGATPEKLYQRKKEMIRGEAMAATRPRGANAEEDNALQKELLSDPKEKREFAFVKEFIHSLLSPLCHSFQEEKEDRIVTTTTVHHLFNCFSGQLKASHSDRDLITLLHPTPAMGGYPREKALSLLKQNEPFSRGWYAAPIGWISPQEADISIGIRSALLSGNELNLFAGTGIVNGSDPCKEWQELEYKIAPFLRLFA